MELLQGETLAARLKREGRIPIGEAVSLVLTVGLAVAMLHERGILHRDLKPSNLFLSIAPDRVMVPKVLDLGAARTVVEHPEDATVAGTTIGSPHYMAFEQAAGRKDLDGRVDEYALAVILYQAITGTRPYENDDTGHAFAKVLAGVARGGRHQRRHRRRRLCELELRHVQRDDVRSHGEARGCDGVSSNIDTGRALELELSKKNPRPTAFACLPSLGGAVCSFRF
jgi:serine/threonine-protein kinase